MTPPDQFGVAPEAWPAGLSRASVELSGNVIFLLDPQFGITYCNPAWDRFALANEAPASVLRSSVVGLNLHQVIPEPLRRFYRDVFSAARIATVTFDYECNSPELLRTFRMQVIPQGGDAGFAVVNSLRVEQPMELAGRSAYAPSQFRYEKNGGIITMCCHCRKTRRISSEETWDWVPDHLRRKPFTVSHGICPVCVDHYYRRELAAFPAP